LKLEKTLTTCDGHFRASLRREQLERFFRSIGDEFLAQAKRERTLLVQYLDQIGIWSGEPVGLVDIGWAGSVLQSLNQISALEGRKLNAVGFFLATWETAQPVAEAGHQMDSFLVHLGAPEKLRDALMPAVAVIEAMFNAPHGSIVGLEPGADGKFLPTYGDEVPRDDRNKQERIRRAAVEFVRDFIALETLPPLQGAPEYVSRLVRRVGLAPTVSEAKEIGRMKHRDGFGTGSPARPLAKVPNRFRRIASPKSTLKQYGESHWRDGYLAQLSPKERAVISAKLG